MKEFSLMKNGSEHGTFFAKNLKEAKDEVEATFGFDNGYYVFENRSWLNLSLEEIVEEYNEGNDEPLDGDGVDRLCDIIKAKINLFQGNITEDEYNGILDGTVPQRE